MKVALFLGALNRGGAESLVCDVLRKSDSLPFGICCLYRKEGDYSKEFHSTGAQFIKVARTGGLLEYLLALRKAILRNHIDIIHAQTPSNALVCSLALLFTKVTIITTFHGFPFSDAPLLYRKLVYSRSRRIICVSNYEKSVYEKRWKLPIQNKFCVVYNGIDFSKLDILTTNPTSALALDKNALNMIMVGNFRSGRSHLFVCRVADGLNKKGIPFNLFFAGRKEPSEPDRYDSCVEFCTSHGLSDRVHFLGGRNDIPDLLRQMDLFIYASEHDTFGIAVLEAMASALPVIVNDWDVMKEVSGNGKYATIYETDNVEDCLSKVLAFRQMKATTPETLNENSSRISSDIRKLYSIENHIKELNDVYNSCC